MIATALPLLAFLHLAVPCATYDRLPRTAFPLNYRLHIKPKMDGDFTYTGELSLDMRMNDTSEVWLDMDDSLELYGPSSMTFDGSWTVPHNLTQSGRRLKVVTGQVMKYNYIVQLNLNFTGRIRRDQVGFYLSSYNFNGTKRNMASTHFESSGARLTFPCFDEPAFRANFSLEITLNQSSPWRAISNTLIVSDTVSGVWRHVVFEEMRHTPVYLVGWAVFEEDSFGNGLPVVVPARNCSSSVSYNVWANREYAGQERLALTAAPLLVQALENFTGISCKAVTKKMDLVAVPDFSAGAMENWGIITFRETALLFDSAYSTALDSQQVLMIVSHELVHQWFGNLVTPDWWSYTWLSEGFARYLQYFITHQIMPILRLDEQFLLDRRQLALEEDGPSAHPLTKEVLDTQADIEDMFDIITYDKGAAIIHMFKSVLGNENFKKGINNYLTRVDKYESILNSFLDEGYRSLKDNTSSLMKLHQMNILWHACYYGQQDCLTAAYQLTFDISGANPERRAALLCTTVRQGNSATWDNVWNRYLSAKSPAESQIMLRALTCTEDRQLIKRFLGNLFSSNIRRHDVTAMISLVCSKRLGAEETFSFFKNNYTFIYNYFQETRSLKKILSSVIQQFNDTQLEELKQVESGMSPLNITSLIKSVEKSISWKKKVYQQLRAFITNETIPIETTTSTDVDSGSGGSASIYNKHTWAATIIIFLSVLLSNL